MANKIPLPENLKHCLIQYIKNKDHQRVGVLVAIPGPNNIGYSLGWSRAHSYMDKFNREHGLDIAFGRAQAMSDLKEMPNSMITEYNKFRDRVDRYYK